MNGKSLYSGLIAVLLFLVVSPGFAGKRGGSAGTASGGSIKVYSHEKKGLVMSDKVVKTEAEWRKQLTPEQFHILRGKGTERQAQENMPIIMNTEYTVVPAAASTCSARRTNMSQVPAGRAILLRFPRITLKPL